MTLILFLAVCFLAYANGANDNFKGVATLLGSKTADYKTAIVWATITTFAGSLSSIFLAYGILTTFSGKDLVPESLENIPEFLSAVAVGAAITVMVATVTGFPISTTHSLTGGLIGAGLATSGLHLNWAGLGNSFLLPLLFSPVLAAGLGGILYIIFRTIRVGCGITKGMCLCVGEQREVVPAGEVAGLLAVKCASTIHAVIDTEENCRITYQGLFLGIRVQQLLDYAHFCSAGVMSFARGLNDTPKIVALLVIVQGLPIFYSMLAVAIGMALGGLLNAGKVAETMSHKITVLNCGQGFTANLVTAMVVILASKFSLPVSTTHVSVGSFCGIGLVTKHLNLSKVWEIVLSWFITLPMAALFSRVMYWILVK